MRVNGYEKDKKTMSMSINLEYSNRTELYRRAYSLKLPNKTVVLY